MYVVIPREEEFLERKFGAQYCLASEVNRPSWRGIISANANRRAF
jgi:hypothetical protein